MVVAITTDDKILTQATMDFIVAIASQYKIVTGSTIHRICFICADININMGLVASRVLINGVSAFTHCDCTWIVFGRNMQSIHNFERGSMPTFTGNLIKCLLVNLLAKQPVTGLFTARKETY